MKVLVSDFDHTFYTSEYKKNIEAIKRFVSAGNLFVIATGRNLKNLLHDIEGFDIPVSYYICNDGASIYDENLNLIYEKNLNPKIVEAIWKQLDKNCFSEVWIDHDSEYFISTEESANKIIARPEKMKECEEVLACLKEEYPITGYFSMNWLNIMDENVDKGNAIQHLETMNGWTEIYTIGDSVNDVGMITKYHGAIMESSKDELKNICDNVVPNVWTFIDLIQ